MTILHIDSSARQEQSNTRTISQYLVDKLSAKNTNEKVLRRDLANEPLPVISAQDLVDLHASVDADRPSLKAHYALSDSLIAELKNTDTLVIGAPLYNFNVPVVLKQWIDFVARAGHTFKYTDKGPVGLSGVKTAYVVIGTGGTPVGSPYDHGSAYLKTVLAFLGVEQVHIIDASGSKGAVDKIIADAKQQVDALI